MIKNLLESVVLFVIISAITSISVAQDIDTTGISNPDVRARLETDYMKKFLSLDSATATSVYDINQKYAKANQEIITSDKVKAVKYREIKKNLNAKDKELKKVLTDDQYKKYTEKKKEIMTAIEEKIKEKSK